MGSNWIGRPTTSSPARSKTVSSPGLVPKGRGSHPTWPTTIGEPAAYNHAIGSLTLSEMYGMGQPKRAAQLKQVIEKSLAATLEMQRWPKDLPVDRGGWRYITDDGINDSDLSITGWQLMFLRSSRNAAFMCRSSRSTTRWQYVRRTFNQDTARSAIVTGPNTHGSRGMAGAGILALAHAGFHHSTEAQRAGQWMLEHPFDEYNGNDNSPIDRYHYSLVQCVSGNVPIGQPLLGKVLSARGGHDARSPEPQRVVERRKPAARHSRLVTRTPRRCRCLALGAPNQFLPVFQR